MPLLFIFIIVPLAELAVLIKVGSYIGILWTFALILLTATIGVSILRVQGLSTLMRASQKLQDGGLPAKELAEGFLLALAGALLLTPGLITDACGFMLLVPTLRGRLAGSVLKRFKPTMTMGSMNGGSPFERPINPADPRVHRDQGGHDIIDGEYRRED
ncbi:MULTISPECIES: FxsA family protein [Thalassolituus]|uniref:FxsA family protein n=1 Tax=Thalassolituus TaxID=187492 RepID=UPI00042DD8CC|nr:FxsA family protein [Thalassolituus oleivorans]AHK16592.1 biotin-(acetyl-CoA carboxylase) ligase [Thalassolituus oleivorans R6-15]MBQ0727844.1 FxsA family protein [Thalassolituus oleivorans]MBQ0782008.1 FxsA family protein [Thalassolituus oleivorans]MDF1639603.1 FxsA family protein [Thalassolituus oleivorans]